MQSPLESLADGVSFKLTVNPWKEPAKGTAIGGRNELGMFGDRGRQEKETRAGRQVFT